MGRPDDAVALASDSSPHWIGLLTLPNVTCCVRGVCGTAVGAVELEVVAAAVGDAEAELISGPVALAPGVTFSGDDVLAG